MDWEQINKELEKFFCRADIKAQMREDFASLIAIPSVASKREGIYTFGHECAKAVDKALELGKKYGFKTINHDYYCASIISGDKPDEIGIVTHLDVVPAGSGWNYRPYFLTVEDDKYIGRGTLDDKGPFICGLYCMRFLNETKKSLPFSVRLIAGSDEEIGSSDLEYFAKVEKPPMFSMTPDAEFPVCVGEKGILQVDVLLGRLPDFVSELGGGSVSNAVPDSAYAVIWDDKTDVEKPVQAGISLERIDQKQIRITATGKSAHAAFPEGGINAIGLLVRYLLQSYSFGIKEKSPFEFLNSACNEYLGKTLGIDRIDRDFNYLTCVGGVLKVVDGIIVQNFNIRYIPDTTYEHVFNMLTDTLTKKGFAAKPVLVSEGYSVSSDDERIQALTQACEYVLGYKCRPYTTGGGTYARWLANTVAFGPVIEKERGKFGDGRGSIHERDEYISTAEIISNIKIYALSILNLGRIYK